MCHIVICLIAIALAACQGAVPTRHGAPGAGITYGGGDGGSADTAIVIAGTNTAPAGIDAEYAWIEKHLPGAKIESQALVMGSPPMDRFEVVLPSGEKRKVYFDISAFFGKR